MGLNFSGNLWDALKEHLNSNGIWGSSTFWVAFGFDFLIVNINLKNVCHKFSQIQGLNLKLEISKYLCLSFFLLTEGEKREYLQMIFFLSLGKERWQQSSGL